MISEGSNDMVVSGSRAGACKEMGRAKVFLLKVSFVLLILEVLIVLVYQLVVVLGERDLRRTVRAVQQLIESDEREAPPIEEKPRRTHPSLLKGCLALAEYYCQASEGVGITPLATFHQLGKLPSADKLQVCRGVLLRSEPLVQLLQQAKTERIIFPQETPADGVLEELSLLKQAGALSDLITTLCLVAGHSGNGDEALSWLKRLPWLAGAFGRVYGAMGFMAVRCKLDTVACLGIEYTLSITEPSEQGLAQLRAALEAEHDSLSALEAIEAEARLVVAQAERLPHSLAHLLSVRPDLQKDLTWESRLMFFAQQYYKQQMGSLLHAHHVAGTEEPQQYEWALNVLRSPDSGRSERFLANLMANSVYTVAGLRVTIAGLAVEQYRLTNGRWPEALSDAGATISGKVLSDPFTGKGLCYVVGPNGVRIYSVGYNLCDDRGDRSYGPGPWRVNGHQIAVEKDIVFELLPPCVRTTQAPIKAEVSAPASMSTSGPDQPLR